MTETSVSTFVERELKKTPAIQNVECKSKVRNELSVNANLARYSASSVHRLRGVQNMTHRIDVMQIGRNRPTTRTR